MKTPISITRTSFHFPHYRPLKFVLPPFNPSSDPGPSFNGPTSEPSTSDVNGLPTSNGVHGSSDKEVRPGGDGVQENGREGGDDDEEDRLSDISGLSDLSGAEWKSTAGTVAITRIFILLSRSL